MTEELASNGKTFPFRDHKPRPPFFFHLLSNYSLKDLFPSLKFCECATLNAAPSQTSGCIRRGLPCSLPGQGQQLLSQGHRDPLGRRPTALQQPLPPPKVCSSREQRQQVRTWWLLRKITLCQLNNTL